MNINTEKQITGALGSEGFNKWCKATSGHSNEVSAILRSHLIAEYYINQIIITYLDNGKIITSKGNFSFHQKLLLIKSFNIINEKTITAIEQLNNVRNNCSHQIDYKLTEDEIDKIGYSLLGKAFTNSKKIRSDYALLKYVIFYIISGLEGALLQISNTGKKDLNK